MQMTKISSILWEGLRQRVIRYCSFNKNQEVLQDEYYYSPDTLLEGWTLGLEGWTLGLDGWTPYLMDGHPN